MKKCFVVATLLLSSLSAFAQQAATTVIDRASEKAIRKSVENMNRLQADAQASQSQSSKRVSKDSYAYELEQKHYNQLVAKAAAKNNVPANARFNSDSMSFSVPAPPRSAPETPDTKK